ncbi:class IV adenylate cyclase [Blastopirellula marina]|uniref:Adenylate cyclase n=1 Tax=Blastopirellula marina TaxID=124 RepID=A0A2S8FSK8_9BACT|nr:class IV adenylate cyclase [Blastopirellula marina]PQO35169.1 adenylate cyclase [Blastopirellula marina]PQO47960.1 adenylate cyclase [Blastopirellula marina]PTL43918.1 CYTH domain-containing protein [Blastopirellula marina]
MARNVEIKARVRDMARLRHLAAELATDGPWTLDQVDIFFHAHHGRLKLRTINDEESELIYYHRDDYAGPKTSTYARSVTPDPVGLRQILSAVLGELGQVRKRRTLYLVGQTRIHLDEVEDLGNYMELEVVLREGQSPTIGEAIAEDLMERLEIRRRDLCDGAYLDLFESSQVRRAADE